MAREEYDGDLNTQVRKFLLQIESAEPGEIHVQHQTTRHFRSRGSQKLFP